MPRRGELYLMNQEGDRKPRPIVIVSNNTLNGGHSVVAVPFYSQQLEKRGRQQWCVIYEAGEGGLDKQSAAKTDEISLVEKIDINLSAGPIGCFNDSQLARLFTALIMVSEYCLNELF